MRQGCNARLIFGRAAEAFHVYSQSSESVQCRQATVGVECDDMCEHAAERECLGRLAKCVNEGVIPGRAIPHIRKEPVELRVCPVEAREQRPGSTLFGRCSFQAWRIAASERS